MLPNPALDVTEALPILLNPAGEGEERGARRSGDNLSPPLQSSFTWSSCVCPKVNVQKRYFTVSDAGCWITPLTSLVESGDFDFVLLGIQEFRNYLLHPTYPPKSSRLFDFRIVFLWGGCRRNFGVGGM